MRLYDYDACARDGDGRTLPESAAILAYLAAATPMLPDDGFARAEVIRWLVWEQTDVVPAIAGLRFRLLTGRLAPADAEARRRSRLAGEVLRVLDGHLSQRDFLVAGRYTIADIAVYGYTHRAAEAGVALEPFPGVTGWIERVEAQPGHIEDVMPYGANAVPGAGRSIYD
jgi:glutathione S-transferase